MSKFRDLLYNIVPIGYNIISYTKKPVMREISCEVFLSQ